jgi:hypothetical protein
MNKSIRIAPLALILAAGLAGCANQPADNSELLGRVERAERAAAEAQAAAAAAQQRADEALAAAQANDQKVDRAFKKSQQK